MNTYYVYIYLNPLKPGTFNYGKYKFEYEPFYVGEGTGRRFKVHLQKVINKNVKIFNHKCATIKSILNSNNKPVVIKIKENLNRYDACLLESKLIKTIGITLDKSGPLTNTVTEHPYLNNGGYKSFKHSEETKKKISETQLNRSPEEKKAFAAKLSKAHKGRIHSKEHHIKIGLALRGRKASTEHREKLSIAHSGKKCPEHVKQILRDKLTGKKRPQWVIDKMRRPSGWKQSEEAKLKMKETKELLRKPMKITNIENGNISIIKNVKDFCILNNLKTGPFRKALTVNGIYKNFKIEYA